MDRRWTILPAICGLFATAGCDTNKTETGYSPRRVGMGSNEIRSLYAPAYSPEAHVDTERKTDVSAHRPGG